MCKIFDLMWEYVQPVVELKLLHISCPLWNVRVRPNLSIFELTSGLGCALELIREDRIGLPVIDSGQNFELWFTLEHRSQVEDLRPAKSACIGTNLEMTNPV